MNVLKAINAFFTKLWRGIRETAWVQPLLIVGGIFALIFSIPRFTSWFQAMAVDSGSGYFQQFSLSLENEGMTDVETEADKLSNTLNDYSFYDYASYAELKEALDEEGVIAKYGIKYYLVVVETDCTPCNNAKDAFETLSNAWNTSSFKINDGGKFAIHTIYADAESTNDEEYDLEEDKKAFTRYVKKFDDRDLWARAAGKLEQVPYKLNKNVASSKYETLENAEANNFETPTIFFVDWSEEAYNADRFGLSEVIFGFEVGTSDYERATVLQQMWNHVPSSASDVDTLNPFRAEYTK